MSDGPEVTRLKERLSGAANFNVWWGDRAHELTAEQRAAELNKTFDEVESGRAAGSRTFPNSGRPKVDVSKMFDV